MNKLTTLSLSALGGTALFAVSFLGFAKFNKVPLDTLPVVGGMFPAQPTEAPEGEDGHSTTPAGDEHATSATPHDAVPTPPAADAQHAGQHDAAKPNEPSVKEAHAGIFDLLDVDGLYTQDELRALGESLRAKNREGEQRGAELDRREELLADRLTALDERRRTMDEFA